MSKKNKFILKVNGKKYEAFFMYNKKNYTKIGEIPDKVPDSSMEEYVDLVVGEYKQNLAAKRRWYLALERAKERGIKFK